MATIVISLFFIMLKLASLKHKLLCKLVFTCTLFSICVSLLYKQESLAVARKDVLQPIQFLMQYWTSISF